MAVMQGYLAAVSAFAGLVERVGDVAWDGPGLGVWTFRDLVGHAVSSGLGEVVEAFDRPVTAAPMISSPEAYYALARQVDPAVYAAAVAASTDDAHRAGDALGAHPAATVRDLAAEVGRRLAAVRPTVVVTTAAGAMVLEQWLPTRTFELAVHGVRHRGSGRRPVRGSRAGAAPGGDPGRRCRRGSR
jgi:hypothetical protein